MKAKDTTPFEDDFELVSKTFEMVQPNASRWMTNFYFTLFMDYPEVTPLFAEANMESLKSKLSASLTFVVHNLRQPAAFKPVLKNLGARHITYGAKPEYYPAVGATLIKTLQAELQDEWTYEVEQAWARAFEMIAEIMIRGAEQDERKRASLLEKFKKKIRAVLIVAKPLGIEKTKSVKSLKM